MRNAAIIAYAALRARLSFYIFYLFYTIQSFEKLGKKKDCIDITLRNLLESGSVLFSRAVSSQVLSALRGLTSVFGMGTGGALQLSSPETFLRGALPRFSSASLRSLRFRSASSPLGSLPLPAPSKLHRSELTSKLHTLLRLPQIKPSTD